MGEKTASNSTSYHKYAIICDILQIIYIDSVNFLNFIFLVCFFFPHRHADIPVLQNCMNILPELNTCNFKRAIFPTLFQELNVTKGSKGKKKKKKIAEKEKHQ